VGRTANDLEADLHEALLLLQELVGVVAILKDGQAMPLKGIGERAADLVRRHGREPYSSLQADTRRRSGSNDR
jgi:hypothetical protein